MFEPGDPIGDRSCTDPPEEPAGRGGRHGVRRLVSRRLRVRCPSRRVPRRSARSRPTAGCAMDGVRRLEEASPRSTSPAGSPVRSRSAVRCASPATSARAARRCRYWSTSRPYQLDPQRQGPQVATPERRTGSSPSASSGRTSDGTSSVQASARPGERRHEATAPPRAAHPPRVHGSDGRSCSRHRPRRWSDDCGGISVGVGGHGAGESGSTCTVRRAARRHDRTDAVPDAHGALDASAVVRRGRCSDATLLDGTHARVVPAHPLPGRSASCPTSSTSSSHATCSPGGRPGRVRR